MIKNNNEIKVIGFQTTDNGIIFERDINSLLYMADIKVLFFTKYKKNTLVLKDKIIFYTKQESIIVGNEYRLFTDIKHNKKIHAEVVIKNITGVVINNKKLYKCEAQIKNIFKSTKNKLIVNNKNIYELFSFDEKDKDIYDEYIETTFKYYYRYLERVTTYCSYNRKNIEDKYETSNKLKSFISYQSILDYAKDNNINMSPVNSFIKEYYKEFDLIQLNNPSKSNNGIEDKENVKSVIEVKTAGIINKTKEYLKQEINYIEDIQYTYITFISHINKYNDVLKLSEKLKFKFIQLALISDGVKETYIIPNKENFLNGLK